MEPYPRTSSHRRSIQGFTLIELSIVLIIIGLIIGGILVGRDMIRTSELRSVLSDVEKFQTAFNSFKLKYNCISGDCPNATDFFGTDSNGCPVGGGATGTCNGNDNGMIEWDNEGMRAWQQLGQAGLIAGNYSGIVPNTHITFGVDAPASKINGVGYNVGYFEFAGTTPGLGYTAGVSGTYDANRITVGSQMSIAYAGWARPSTAAFLTTDEAYVIDLKIDDGKPASGNLTVMPNGHDAQSNSIGICSFSGASVSSASTIYASTLGIHDLVYCSVIFSLGM